MKIIMTNTLTCVLARLACSEVLLYIVVEAVAALLVIVEGLAVLVGVCPLSPLTSRPLLPPAPTLPSSQPWSERRR